jgi:hypothetical protein
MKSPRRKKPKTTPAFQRGREFKVILPPDISERIEGQAKAEGKPQSRIIINDLARIPDLDQQAKLGGLVRDLEVMLARYGSRDVVADLGDALLQAVDGALAAKTDGELRSRLDRLRVLRADMLKHERIAKE